MAQVQHNLIYLKYKWRIKNNPSFFPYLQEKV